MKETENANVADLNQENVIVRGREKEGREEKGREAIGWNILKLMMVERSKLKKNLWMVIVFVLFCLYT